MFRRMLFGAGLVALAAGIGGWVQTAAAGGDLAAAKAVVDAHSAQPVFSAPGEAFDAKKVVSGKKLLVIPSTSANPWTKGIAQSEIVAAKKLGFELMEWENQGRPTEWVQGMEYAINNKFSAIELMGGQDPALLLPQIKQAHDAGLKVFVSHSSDSSEPGNPNVDLTMPVSYNTVGDLFAAWIAVKTEGKAKVLIVGSDDARSTHPFVKGITDGLAKYCGDSCPSSYINVPLAEWASKIQPGVQSALIADPTITYVVPIYDSMSQFVLPAIRITGNQGKVKIVTYNGTPFVLDAVRNGDVEMDVGESLNWIAYAILDAEMRHLAGLPDVKELNVPLYIFDKSNVESAGIPAGYDNGFGTEFIGGYEKLWKLK